MSTVEPLEAAPAAPPVGEGPPLHPAAAIFPPMTEARLEELARNIQEYGQRQPIVMHEGQVLDGRNRWLACRRIGREPITVEWDGAGSPWQYAWDQNAERRDLEPGQRAALRVKCNESEAAWQAQQLERQEQANQARREAAAQQPREDGRFASPPAREDAPVQSRETAVRTRQRIAAQAGTSPATVARVVELREQRPALFEKLANGELTLGEARREMRRERKQAVVREIRKEPAPLPEGPFRVVVVDPPWRYDTAVEKSGLRGLVDYADMSIEEICALPVAKLAHADAALWLWTTNSFMRAAYRCLDAWGFEEKTILTWDKERLGTGSWLRNTTEHCILAVRGRPVLELGSQPTLIREKRREHSRKPEAFYRLVESLCPGSKVELFARGSRPAWTSWGAERSKFDG